jgi:hypothetical protein
LHWRQEVSVESRQEIQEIWQGEQVLVSSFYQNPTGQFSKHCESLKNKSSSQEIHCLYDPPTHVLHVKWQSAHSLDSKFSN